MSEAQERLLKRRQAAAQSIGHLKANQRMRRNFLKGDLGDTKCRISAAAGFNTRWLISWLVVFWRQILCAFL